jgi:hypothetical protein
MEPFKRFLTMGLVRPRPELRTPPVPTARGLRSRLNDEVTARVLLAADYRELRTAATWLVNVITDLELGEGSDLWAAHRNLKGVLEHQVREI